MKLLTTTPLGTGYLRPVVDEWGFPDGSRRFGACGFFFGTFEEAADAARRNFRYPC